MDGHEWKRSKYSAKVKKFLLYAEKLAVQHSSYLIADSVTIKSYLKNKYNKPSTFIPYGANVFSNPDRQVLAKYGLKPYSYDGLIARLEPDNSIEVILDGVAMSSCKRPFIVIGNSDTKYGLYLKDKFAANENIRFLNGIYDIDVLNNLRYFSNLYFHGHTVGGTNPSLLEAMASSALICAHDNVHNASVLADNAYYFKTAEEVRLLLDSVDINESVNQNKIMNNVARIESHYRWEMIIDQYESHFLSILGKEGTATEVPKFKLVLGEKFDAALNTN